jgi:arylsulfatase A-like enzyme
MPRKKDGQSWAPTRRDFFKAAGLTIVQMNLLLSSGMNLFPSSALAQETQAKPHTKLRGRRRAPNILLILNDQERYFDKLPPKYRLPGKERLQELGTEFTNQQISSCVCTSSRSNIYTGQHIQKTKMFDNLNFPWVENLSTDIPTIGHMMRELGYYSAYQGKFHLNRELEHESTPPQLIGRDLLNEYGFSDYTGIGDSIGMTLGGYLNDSWIASFTSRWLKVRGQKLNAEGIPWFLAVNFVNPHDVMFYNTDLPGEKVQEQDSVLSDLRREPNYGLYQQQWELALPESRRQAWDADNRPSAHFDYQKSRSGLVGGFPNEDGRWQRLMNYYLNCIQDADRHILTVLEEVTALGMGENTIIVRTSDHGELGGSHGMHGKGATAYREQNHVPMHVVHPDVKGGRTCAALTSHIDIVPTLVSMAGGDESKKAALLARLKGKDFSGLLNDPKGAGVNELREAILYNFNMLIYEDPDFTLGAIKILTKLGKEKGSEQIQRQGLKPDFNKHRGAIRSVFDGRYKFNRYFSPLQHNQPKTFEELTAINDIELFDQQNDPNEMVNLAADRANNKQLIMAMNAKLNAIIKEEVGRDDGSSMGLSQDTDYAFSKADI